MARQAGGRRKPRRLLPCPDNVGHDSATDRLTNDKAPATGNSALAPYWTRPGPIPVPPVRRVATGSAKRRTCQECAGGAELDQGGQRRQRLPGGHSAVCPVCKTAPALRGARSAHVRAELRNTRGLGHTRRERREDLCRHGIRRRPCRAACKHAG